MGYNTAFLNIVLVLYPISNNTLQQWKSLLYSIKNGIGGCKYATLHCHTDKRWNTGTENINTKRREGLPHKACTNTAEAGSEAGKQGMDVWPHQRCIRNFPQYHCRHCTAIRHGRDGGGPGKKDTAKPPPQSNRRSGNPDMRHSLFRTAWRCLTLDYAGNRGRADPSGSSWLYYGQHCLRGHEKNEIKPWLVKEWCIPEADAEFVSRMEDVLEVY